MHRSSKRIVAPLFLLLAAAVIFVPQVRADEIPLLNFTFSGSDTLTFTLPQNPIPDVAGTDDFRFLKVPVFASFMPPNTPITYDIYFSREPGLPVFEMSCDPFTFSLTAPPFFHCDFVPRIDQTATAMWSGSGNNPTFIPGVYGNLTISETPEPSPLALLLMSFATLFLLAVGVRPSHR
jgi:hypothetical protein